MNPNQLQKIPSPLKIPFLGHLPYVLSRDPFGRMLQLGERYGDLFNLQLLNDSVVITSDPDVVRELFDETRFRKRVAGILESIRPIAGDGLITAEDHEDNWGRAHRILKPGFGRKAMSDYLPVIIQQTRKLIAWWRSKPEKLIDANQDFTRLTLEIIGLCGFNYSFLSFEQEEPHSFMLTIDSILAEATISHQLPAWANKLRPGGVRRLRDNIADTNKVFDKIINDHKTTQQQDKSSFLSLMLDASDPKDGSKLSLSNIRYQLITFLIAGHETTRSLLSFTVYYLTKHPKVLQRAQRLVDEVMGESDRDLTFQDLSRLYYLQQILYETLRLWPTAPGFMVSPRETTSIRSRYKTSPDDIFFIFLSALHRHPKAWGKDADIFNPERFSAEQVRSRPSHVYRPFGNGKRSCIGQHFAMAEAQIALAYILYHFDLEGIASYNFAVEHSLTIKPKDFFFKVYPRDEAARHRM